MKRIGFVGLGDMGIGLTNNLLKKGFEVTGFDIRKERTDELVRQGGKPADNCREVGENSDAVFVMVLNGKQVKDVVLGKDGLVEGLKPGSTIIVTATINPSEIRELEAPLSEQGIQLVDTPVSGGKSGADNGTLTMMVAAGKDVDGAGEGGGEIHGHPAHQGRPRCLPSHIGFSRENRHGHSPQVSRQSSLFP